MPRRGTTARGGGKETRTTSDFGMVLRPTRPCQSPPAHLAHPTQKESWGWDPNHTTTTPFHTTITLICNTVHRFVLTSSDSYSASGLVPSLINAPVVSIRWSPAWPPSQKKKKPEREHVRTISKATSKDRIDTMESRLAGVLRLFFGDRAQGGRCVRAPCPNAQPERARAHDL